ETYTAELLSHDPKTDLAVIKIEADHEFEIAPIGTSSDLMPGEDVIAVGNAFGYEHTVTRGIISALHRTVQVSDTQFYEDLIQTDASINPGNSGGPLLNIDGQMVGVNVAVRAGAQGIGFAIPIDTVLCIATDLMSVRRLENKWHGLDSKQLVAHETEGVLVQGIDREGPAATGGLLRGDVITSIDQKQVSRPLDIERRLLGRKSTDTVEVTVQRNSQPVSLKLALSALPQAEQKAERPRDQVWDTLGLKLEQAPASRFQGSRSPYRGGMTVVDVRPDGPAAKQGIRRGDVLVGMHLWETVSTENVQYVLNHADLGHDPVKFFILRGSETRFGHLQLGSRTQR
ncbi:MAG: PDZ domain-containing protein, partial [Planctomycetaceae bacterium]|nr:PDZ domain-containing protein [Planctomycetaceae bacterium]